jgi:glutathione S-transferase
MQYRAQCCNPYSLARQEARQFQSEMILSLPALFSFRRCPYAMRARMAIGVARYKCSVREVNLAQKPAQLLDLSPKATVPVLVLSEDQIIDESLDIMTYVLTQHDPEGWLTAFSDRDRALISIFDTDFKGALDAYKYPNRQRNAQQVSIGLPREKALSLLGLLEERLASQPFLSAQHFTFADAAIFPFVRQFAGVDHDWFARQPIPNIQRWLSIILAMPLFAAIMVKIPVWTPDSEPFLFPHWEMREL